MDTLAAITAHPRTPHYLPRTITSIKAAGWEAIHVFANPGAEQESDVVWHQHKERLWPMPSFRVAMEYLLASNADSFLICQDDIELTVGCRRWLEETLPLKKAFGVASLFTPEKLHCPPSKLPTIKHGWYVLPDSEIPAWGAQAYWFTRSSAEEFFAIENHNLTQIDHYVLAWCRKNKKDYWVHSPSLAQHLAPTEPSFYSFHTPELAQQCRPYREAKHFAANVTELERFFR